MARFKTDILWLLLGTLVGASGMDLYWDYAVSLLCIRVFRASNGPLLHRAADLSLGRFLSWVDRRSPVRECASSCVLTTPSAQTRLPAAFWRCFCQTR